MDADVMDIIYHWNDGASVIFVVQGDGGPSFNETDANKLSTEDYQRLVVRCFEGLYFLHRQGIAHLDM